MPNLQSLSILTKALGALLPVFLLLFIILGIVTYSELDSIRETVYKSEKNQLQKDIVRSLGVKTEAIKNIVIAISQNGEVINKMYDEKRDDIYQEIARLYNALELSHSFKKPLIQVVDTMGTSYVKSWDKNAYGAIVTDRKSVRDVQDKNKAYIGNEVTRGGLMMVATAPLMLKAEDADEDDEFLGSIDFILRFNNLVFKKQNLKDRRDLLVLVKKENLKKAMYIKNPQMVENYYVDLQKDTINQKFLAGAQKLNIKELLKKGHLTDENYFYTYEHIKDNEGKPLGIFLLGKSIEDVDTSITKTSQAFMTLIGIVVFAILVILVIIIFILKKVVSEPIQSLADVAKDLSSGDGDLTKRLKQKSDDEIGKTSLFINKFIEKVQTVVSKVIVSGHKTANDITHMTGSIDNICILMSKERDLVNQTTTLSNNIQSLLEHSVNDSIQTVEKVELAVKNLDEADQTIAQLVHDVEDMAQKEHEMSASLSQLSSEANEVKAVLTIISDIADQTNLLALNAAIEAARAGEHGRGFAVVADEVRKLAERTQKTLAEIHATINIIVQSIMDTGNQMEINAKAINQLVDSTNAVEEKIQETVVYIKDASSIAKNSENESKDLASTTQNIISNINSVNEISIQNSDSLQAIGNKATELQEGSKELNKQLDLFKV